VQLATAHLRLSQRRFKESLSLAEQTLTIAGSDYKDIAIQAKGVRGAALAGLNETQRAARSCEEALAQAEEAGNRRLRSTSLLRLAEISLDARDASRAALLAEDARQQFSRYGQHDSNWRACLVLARALIAGGNAEKARIYVQQASESLAHLRGLWRAEIFESYLARPDVQVRRQQLEGLMKM
jgi:tetratricopeptide (TPR) repeat protein